MAMPEAMHGALWPVVRQVVQHAAGWTLGAGVLAESEITVVAGLLMAVGNVIWMLVARAKQK